MKKEIHTHTYIENARNVVNKSNFDEEKLKSVLEPILQQRAFVADEERAEAIAGERILDSKIKQALDFINQRKYKIAQTILIKIRDEETEDNKYDFATKARLANNIGITFLHLDDVPTAQSEFISALALEPNNPKYLGNAAMTAFLNNDPTEALKLIEQAKTLLPNDSQIITVYVQALNANNKLDEIEELIKTEHWILEDAFCLLALGTVYFVRGDFAQAEDYLRKSLEKDSSEPQAYSLLSGTLYHLNYDTLVYDLPLPWKKPESMIEQIKEAQKLSEKEVELLKDSESRNRYHQALVNLAQLKSILNDKSGAISDCDKVLLENEKNDYALNTKAVTLYHQKKFQEAVELFEKVQDPSIKKAGINIHAMGLINIGKAKDAIELIMPYWESVHGQERIPLGEVLTIAYLKLEDKTKDKTNKVLEVINSEELKNYVDAVLLKSEILFSNGETLSAQQLLLDLIESATDNQKDRIHLILGNQSYFSGKWEAAAEHFSNIITQTAPLEIKQQYAVSLVNSGKYEDALVFCSSQRTSDKPIPGITDIEAQLLEYKNDLTAALSLRLLLHSSSEEVNELHLIKAYMLALRLGDENKAKDIIEQIDLSKIQDNPTALSLVAQAYIITGLNGAIQMAYKARQLAFENPEYHLAYFRVFLARENQESNLFTVDQIGDNCAFKIFLSNGEKHTYIIADDETPDRQKNIINSTDPLAVKVLGKREGDEFVFRENNFQTITAKIIEVKTKYVHAFQETTLKFQDWFPENAEFFTIDVGDNDFSVLFSELDKRFAHVNFIMRKYNEKKLPLSVLAKLLGRSRMTVWQNLTSNADSNIFAAGGNVNDALGQIDSNKVVLDLGAIMSAYYLNILDKLPEIFEKIYVPQSVLDEISEELINQRLDLPKDQANISRSADGYTYFEYNDEDQNEYIEYLEKLRDFIKNYTEIVPLSAALTLDKEKLNDLIKIFGEPAISSILVAQEKSALLYADDLAINQFAETEWNVSYVWSQVILANLRKSGLITSDEYNEGLYKLILANYKFVSFEYENIEWAVVKNEWKVSKRLEHFMKCIEGPEINEDWAVGTCGELIRKGFLEISQSHARYFFFDFILKVLVKDRIKRNVLIKLQKYLARRLYLLPIQFDQISRTIEIWKLQK